MVFTVDGTTSTVVDDEFARIRTRPAGGGNSSAIGAVDGNNAALHLQPGNLEDSSWVWRRTGDVENPLVQWADRVSTNNGDAGIRWSTDG